MVRADILPHSNHMIHILHIWRGTPIGAQDKHDSQGGAALAVVSARGVAAEAELRVRLMSSRSESSSRDGLGTFFAGGFAGAWPVCEPCGEWHTRRQRR